MVDAHTGPTASERSPAGFDLRSPSADQYKALTADLTPNEREVILEYGTEAPFCGVFNEAKAAGAYVCRLCGLPLFRSGTKSDSGPDGRASLTRLIARISRSCGTPVRHGPY